MPGLGHRGLTEDDSLASMICQMNRTDQVGCERGDVAVSDESSGVVGRG